MSTLRERIAEAVYNAMRVGRDPEAPHWTPGGNSLAQHTARGQADVILALLQSDEAVERAQQAYAAAKSTWRLHPEAPLSTLPHPMRAAIRALLEDAP